MTPSELLVHLLSAILFMVITAVDAAPLVLFEDSHFRGVRTELVIERNNTEACVNIRGKLNDFFSSVEAEGGECYLLCQHEHCRGLCVPVTHTIHDLSTVGLNDAASSVKRCPKTPQLHTEPPTDPTEPPPTTTTTSSSNLPPHNSNSK